MQLVRTFHPVGHGAFYTEQFYEKEHCVYTAVYDCGGNPEGGINTYIDNNFSNQRIDVIFISHLHNDHISGISHLLQKNDCKKTKIFIPLLTPEQKITTCIENLNDDVVFNGTDSNELIKNIYAGDLKDKVVEVEFDEDRIRENVIGESQGHNVENISSCSNTVKSGVPLKGEVESWIYYPYNTNHPLSGKFVSILKGKRLINGNGEVDFNELEALCENKKKLRQLTDEYRHNVGHFNEYSMTVYSGYDDPMLYCHYCCCDCRCHSNNGICVFNPNCLFTGDYVADEENISRLKSFYGEYFCCSPTLQIPHHCSDRLNKKDDRYGLSLFNNCNDVVMSIKYEQYPGIPSGYLLLELQRKGLTPQIVTEKRNTCLEKVYRIYTYA